MKYALMIYVDPSSWDGMSEEEAAAVTAEYNAVRESAGVYDGARLEDADTATTVRVADGESLLTDGPFVDAKEYLGGFFLLEADNIDAALAIAARIPAARSGGAVEVRPIVEM